MEILLDTANIETIRRYNEIYDITGVTSNPTIISRENADFFETLTTIRQIIGDKQLHVQVSATDFDEMMKEAEYITQKLGKDTYIKIPVNETGIKAIKTLKQKGYNVTATAIYTIQQAALAASVGADYVAPYFNRMENLNYDAAEVIAQMSELFAIHNKNTKILAASFKNTNQIINALQSGAEAVTASPELYTQMLTNPAVDSAIDTFSKDWEKIYSDKKIYEL